MHTYLLSDDDIRRYGRDLISRLEGLGERTPRVWCALGVSGDRLAEFLLKEFRSSPAMPKTLVRISADRKTGNIQCRETGGLPEFDESSVLLLDSAIHSGFSMRVAAGFLQTAGADNLLTYSLVLKRTTEFAPTFFGLVIDEHDRAFFQLDRLPDNKLLSKRGYGNIRALRSDDVGRTPDHVATNVASLEKITFADLWYGVAAKGEKVFVFERGGDVRAFIHFKLTDCDRAFIDAVVCDQELSGQGIGGLLMRWVETLARASLCRAIELWAIEDRISMYEHLGYEIAEGPGSRMDLGGDERYTRMRRRILYNVKPSELS